METPFEEIKFGFDIAKLVRHLQTVVLKLPPMMQSAAFGGWSVLSQSGNVADGWNIYSESGALLAGTLQSAEGSIADFKVPTEICTGYLAEVMSEISRQGFNPRRARVSLVPPEQSPPFHVDAVPDAYSVRLHIPILTNPGCRFEYEDCGRHMEANGNGVLVRVNRMHRAINLGLAPRYHLIMDIVDLTGLSQHHRFNPASERLLNWGDFLSTHSVRR